MYLYYVVVVVACYLYLVPTVSRNNTNPCVPSPCGPNSQCRVIGSQAACSCIPNYKGRPPNCRPECTINAECPSNKACQNELCIDPCPGSCGLNALCNVVDHSSICTCIPGYEGNPTTECTVISRRKKNFSFIISMLFYYIYLRYCIKFFLLNNTYMPFNI